MQDQSLLPTSPFTKALAYALGRRAELSVFLGDPDVPIDTNHLERALRPIPMGRKNWMFCWSEIGAKHVGTLQSLLVTCRLHQLGSLAEGLADAAAGQWVFGRDVNDISYFPPNLIQDATVPHTLDMYDPTTDIHDNASIFSHVMYEISKKPGVTDAALANLMLETYNQMTPAATGNVAVYELGDALAVMDDVASGNSVLRDAVSDVLSQMGGTAGGGSGDPGGSGGGSGGGTTARGCSSGPSVCRRIRDGCSGGTAQHQNFWQTVFGATNYEIY